MKVVVTGGAGFIGANLCRDLAARSRVREVIALDDLSTSDRHNLEGVDKVTLVGRAIGGHIMGWGGQEVRLLDEFYKGGETVRGFYRSGIGPRDLNTNDALGGTTINRVFAPTFRSPSERGVGSLTHGLPSTLTLAELRQHGHHEPPRTELDTRKDHERARCEIQPEPLQ